LVEESRLLDAARSRETQQRVDDVRSTYEQRRKRNLLDFAGRSAALGSRQARSSRSGRGLLD
ncbi:MAG: hypothetical protein WAS21_22655, partial [Geminicoccaceae bacterium]